MPVISVVIPVYNGEKTIKQTIESVLNQTFTDFELIIINDGSQDGTLDIISKIQDERIKVFSYPNAGVNVSRNRGFKLAAGEFITFLDDDDLWTPDKLEAQYKALLNNPQAGVAISWTDWIDESGKIIGRGGYVSWEGDALARMLLNDFVESGSNALIRKQALIEVGGFDESLTHAEDWDMWLRLAARYHYTTVPKVQILYRIAANSVSSNVVKMEQGSLQVLERAYANAPESIQHLKQVSLANRYKYLTYKALEGAPVRYKGLLALRFLWLAIQYDPVLLQRRIIWKVLFRIAIVVLFPSPQAQVLLNKFKQLSSANTLLTLLQVNLV
ncbi:glycosyltransferase [Microseira sp. BLCC-F43]|jgi:glycosyltransferase involved in cell wall biosynthesis|uniref:glycosyltransferase n=1 Tax=Microseira sp. BLCC-F43 TaxID=3153602 RepID=UPI0035B772FA